MQNTEIDIHKVSSQDECDVKLELLIQEERYNKEATCLHNANKEGSKFVLPWGCPIRHLIHMEEKKSSQAMVAAKKELAVEDKATHTAAPKGDTFQLTYALQNDNVNCQDEVISEFVDVFPKVLLFVKFLLIL